MEKALILLKVETLGKDNIEGILQKVKAKQEVKEAGITFGDYDIYLIAEVEKSLEMTKLVMEIRGFPSVISTTTLLIVG